MKLHELSSPASPVQALVEDLSAQRNDPFYTDWRTATQTSLAHPDWETTDPKVLIDGMIADLVVPVSTHARLRDLQILNTDTQPPLQSYVLSRLEQLPDLTTATQDYLPTGTLKVRDSMRCLRDEARTKKFLQGVGEAIEYLAASTDGLIEVVDAGTGSVPIMAIYAALCSDRVRCTALELNPASVLVARGIVASMGLQDKVEVVEADATTYTPDTPIGLLVSETMHSGLAYEPIVQIMSNLQPYVQTNGIVLPAAVKVMAGISKTGDLREPRGWTQIAGQNRLTDCTPDWHNVAFYVPGATLNQIAFSLPVGCLAPGEYFTSVASEVSIGSQVLRLYQSAITFPLALRENDGRPMVFGSVQNIRRVDVAYEPGSDLAGVATLVEAH